VGAACAALQQRGARDVIVTCGSQGVFHTADGQLVWMAAHQVDVIDVTGAGDAFSAAVCWSLYQNQDAGDDLTLACRRGLALAAVTVQSKDTVSAALDVALLDAILPSDAAPDHAAPLYTTHE
jgi:pseudouridine kinase